MKLAKIAFALVTASYLAACAQPEPEPVMVAPEPVYDKYGNVVN